MKAPGPALVTMMANQQLVHGALIAAWDGWHRISVCKSEMKEPRDGEITRNCHVCSASDSPALPRSVAAEQVEKASWCWQKRSRVKERDLGSKATSHKLALHS